MATSESNNVLHITSTEIKAYPLSGRSGDIDFNSKLNSEQNIVSIVNRLTSKPSFLVSGGFEIAEKKDNKKYLNATSDLVLNMYGYLFNITAGGFNNLNIELSNSKNFIYFNVNLKSKTLSNGTYSSNVYQLQYGTDNGGIFLGLNIITDRTTAANDTTTSKYLLIASKDTSGNWSINPNISLKYNAEDLNINLSNITNLVSDKYKENTNLHQWLIDNYNIDDGELN